MTRQTEQNDRSKNTRNKKTPYETRPRQRFDVQAEVVGKPRIASRIYRTTDAQIHAVASCWIGNQAIGQPYTVRFVGPANVERAFELVRGDRILLRDAFYWGPQRTAGYQEIHAPRFEYVADGAWRVLGPTEYIAAGMSVLI